ncbi:MAG: glycosyltransferase family 61 protein [Nibricoccus sp.]
MVIATTQGVGYSHWLLEELPRLLAIDLKDCDAIIANIRERFAREALQYHGFPGKVLPVRRDHHVQCEQLLIPSLPGPAGWPTPEVVRLLMAFSEKLQGTKSSFKGERLYISRARARRRRVVDEDVLSTRLEAEGFRTVFLEDMSWPEQIAVFRDAREIVSPHGAGLGNLVFCKAGTRVVEFFSRTYVNPCFWRLSALKGLDYRVVVPAGDEPLAQNLNANRNDINVDVAQVLRALG